MADAVPNPNSNPQGESAAEAALRAAQEAILAAQAINSPAGDASSTEADDAALAAAAGADPNDEVVKAMLAAMREDPGTTTAKGGSAAGPGVKGAPMNLPDFGAGKPKSLPSGVDLLGDVQLNVRIELGRTRMLLEDVLKLGDGTVVELDKLAGDPVDIYVNDRPVARGEVLVLNDNFCIRISEVYSKEMIAQIEGKMEGTKPAA
jgi:flagellar motor switch protein FliN/FliY